MPRGVLGITVRCVCKSIGGCHCSHCKDFLNNFHKPLQDYGPIALSWKAMRVSSADLSPKSHMPFMPQGGTSVFR